MTTAQARWILVLLAMAASSGCSDPEATSDQTAREVAAFQNKLSGGLSLGDACKELETLCAATGFGCTAHQLFCTVPTQEHICQQLAASCPSYPAACDVYNSYCRQPPRSDGRPAPSPDARVVPRTDTRVAPKTDARVADGVSSCPPEKVVCTGSPDGKMVCTCNPSPCPPEKMVCKGNPDGKVVCTCGPSADGSMPPPPSCPPPKKIVCQGNPDGKMVCFCQ